MSHKFKSAGLKYEIGISIYSGDIVWVYGPHRGGKHDLTIFREALKHMLDDGEMVEADKAYIGEGKFIRLPLDAQSTMEWSEKNNLRARHETCNGRFKTWNILETRFRNTRDKHAIVFRAVVAMTQLDIDFGNVLYSCEPKTKKQDSYTY